MMSNPLLTEAARRLQLTENALTARLRGRQDTARVVPKRGGSRVLHVPSVFLKQVQGVIADLLQELPVHDSAHGFVRGRSTLTNAAIHTDAQVVVNMDLQRFYDCVTEDRLRKCLTPILSTRDTAFVLRACTVDGALIQGSPASQVLANFVAYRLDEQLTCVAGQLGFRYTRYVDDLTFSARAIDSRRLRARVALLLKAVRRGVGKLGFKLAKLKTRVAWASQRQEVTGLIVNGEAPPRSKREYTRRVRAALHAMGAAREDRWSDQKIRGAIAFIQMCENEKGLKLLHEFHQLQLKPLREP